jgi:hypothetical protein
MSTIDRGKAKAQGQEAVRIIHSGGYGKLPEPLAGVGVRK